MAGVAAAATQVTTKPDFGKLSRVAAKTQTEYFAIFMGGKKIGHCKHARCLDDGKVTTTETMVMTIRRLGTAMTVRQSETCFETAAGKPLGFKSVQTLGTMEVKMEGTVDAAGKVSVTTTIGQNVRKQTMDWPEGALMSEGLRLLERKKGLKEGTTYTVEVFAASMLTALKAEIRIGATRNVDLLGRVVPLTEVTTVIKAPTGAVTTTSYTDSKFRMQKTVMSVVGIDVEVVACSRHFALSKNDVADFLNRFLLSPPKPLTGVASARSITYTLEPITQPGKPAGKAKLRFPATDNQTVRNLKTGGVVVTVCPIKPKVGTTFPYKGKDKVAVSALKATRFLQCDDKKIKSLARKAVGDTKDTLKAARKIEAFVRKYIKKKDLSVGYASAVEVAASRQGDCTEHAVLTAALCRAVGIPAQVVTGVAYVESFGGRKGVFGPHAWNRVLIGKKWVGFDAALGQYDAGHITMTAGDGSQDEFFGIISTLGCFKIAKVTIQK